MGGNESSGCWESGGPIWLFDVAVLGGFGALICGGLWVLAWSAPSARPRPGPVHAAALCVPVVVGIATVFVSRPGATELVAPVVVAIVLGLAALAIRRRYDADLTGIALSPAWGVANKAVRWAVPIAALAAATAALTAVATMAALGGPC